MINHACAPTASPRSRLAVLAGAFLLLLGATEPCHGALSFVFDYGGGDTGFNDPSEGATRRTALESAATTLGSWFDHTASLHIDARSIDDKNDATLAYAGSAYAVTSGFRGHLMGIVGEKIISNGLTDGNGLSADGELTINFGHSWDLDDQVDASSYDFKSIVMHEMLHAIGFASGINEDGTDIWGAETPSESTPGGGGSNGGIWSPFDDYIVDVQGNSIIDDNDFHIDLVNWNADSTGGASPDGGLFFDGTNARAANGGQPIGLFTPNTYSPGSSVSHLDTDFKPFENLLMAHSSQPGQNSRNLSRIEKGILTDLGFQIIPEPSAAFLIALGALLVGLRRRRKVSPEIHP